MLMYRVLRPVAFLMSIILGQLTCVFNVSALERALKESNFYSSGLFCTPYKMNWMNNTFVKKINDQPLPLKVALWGSAGLLAAGTICGLYIGIKKGAQAFCSSRALPTVGSLKAPEESKPMEEASNHIDVRQSMDELISRYRTLGIRSEEILQEFTRLADSHLVDANDRAECMIHMAYLYSELGQWVQVKSLCLAVLRGFAEVQQWRAYALYYLGECLMQQDQSFYDLNDALQCFTLALSYDGLSDRAKRNVLINIAAIEAALRKVALGTPEFLSHVRTCFLQDIKACF
jgi:hypothetical protein